MKTHNIALLSLLLAAGTAVQAASQVDLAVTGRLTPTACTPLLSNGAVIDYGKISRQDLNVDKGTRLPIKPLQVRIACNGAQPLRLAHAGQS